MGNPSVNIAQFWNLGTERYECLKTSKIDAFIDVLKNDNKYKATLPLGKLMVWVLTDSFVARSKKTAVLNAFDLVVKHCGKNRSLLNELCCPDILRPYKLVTETSKENIQLELF